MYSIVTFYGTKTNSVFEEGKSNNEGQVCAEETTENTCLLNKPEGNCLNSDSIIPNGVLIDALSVKIEEKSDTSSNR